MEDEIALLIAYFTDEWMVYWEFYKNINFMATFSMTILLFSLNGRCDRHIRVSPHAPDSSQHSCRFYHYHALQSFQILINTFV